MSGDITMNDQVKTPEPLECEYLALHNQVESEQPGQSEDETEQQSEIPSSELLKPVFQMVGGILKPVLEDAEINALSEAYGALLDKYFPDSSRLLGVELNCLLITAAVAVPRLQYRAAERKAKKEAQDKEADQTMDSETVKDGE